MLGGLALAVALNRPRRGVGLYRSAIYLPMVFSLAVTGLFWRVQYQPDGTINTMLGAIGLESVERQWLADPNTALYAVLVAAVWRQVGYVMVLYLAGLKGTDPTLDDAAAVDGAGAWQRFRFVTWPQLRGVNTVVFAVTVIDSLRTFDIVWAMTQGGPYHSSELLSTYMFQQGFTFLNLGYASAIAVVIFVLAICLHHHVPGPGHQGGGRLHVHRDPDSRAREDSRPPAGQAAAAPRLGVPRRHDPAHPALGRADGVRAGAGVPLVRRHRRQRHRRLAGSRSAWTASATRSAAARWAGRCGPASR